MRSPLSPSRWVPSTVAEPSLILASASPRRLDLLRLAGLEPVVCPADVDESRRSDEAAVAYVTRLARDKARCSPVEPGCVVLAADTAVVLDAELLGKPRDPGEAVAMLRRLRGRTHRVSTGVAVVTPGGGLAETVVTTEVVMAPLSDAVIDAYVATGDPLDKAGAYGIQGRAAAFVVRIDGSWTNVVGLPLVETLDLLRDAGLAVP